MSDEGKESQETSPSEDRDEWGNKVQFLLTCIGLAVGLGNIWRFPGLAYQNGGSAFLFPYIICSIFFGLPCLYLEFVIGQFTRTGPSLCFKHYMPALQGIGWVMIIIAASIGIYYTVIIAWTGVYLFYTWNHAEKWALCANEWNTHACRSQLQNEQCSKQTGFPSQTSVSGVCLNNSAIVDGSWILEMDGNGTTDWTTVNLNHTIGASEEYFERFILRRSSGLTDFDGMNWPVVISLAVMWIILAATLSKGVKYIGKVSYITATVPYMIILALFIRAITLDGAMKGIRYYLGAPDYSKLLSPKTWAAALTQLCFSLSIGWGGLLSMASYNKKSNNCFVDASIVAFADSFMSIFGGCAVFGILGYLSEQLGRPLDEIVQSGTSLAFVAYPEAMARMPLPQLWSYLFFLMLFLLGMSTQITIAECMCTGICDSLPSLRTKRWLVVIIVCITNFLCGLLLCTNAGIYWFTIFNKYTGTTMLCTSIVLEVVVVVYCYGVNNLCLDIRSMLGRPTNVYLRVMGSSGYYIKFCWLVTVPILAAAVGVLSSIPETMTYGKGDNMYVFEWYADLFGWSLAVLPGLAIPALFVSNAIKWRNAGKPMVDLFRVQPSLPSFDRMPDTSMKSRYERSEEDRTLLTDSDTHTQSPTSGEVGSAKVDMNYSQ